MASIKKQGKGYKITVSHGYTADGKQLRAHMTWIPEPGMTARQIEKELQRQAILFEEQAKCNTTHDGSIRFSEFSELFLRDYAYPNLKARSAYGYEEKLVRINEAIGHIKLKDLRPGHIAAFYANLQEPGMRADEYADPKVDLSAWLKDHHTSMAALSRSSGVSVWVFKKMKNKETVGKCCAEKVASAMGLPYDKAFTTKHSMEPLSPGTIHTYHRTLSAVLFRAVKWGYIQSNPAARADLPSLAGHQAKYLDEPDARKLLELLQLEPIKWRAIMTFDLLSGLRRGELAGLCWQDVDFDHQIITVRQTSNYLPPKGVYTDTPKSSASGRVLRLSRSAFMMLLEYKEWQDAQQAALGDAWRNTDGRIFTTDDGAPIFPDSITQWFTKFVRRSGLPPVTVHSMRHTYASLMIADGAPLVIVSHQLGHAQTSTTANIYAHVIASAEARAAQTFDRFDDVLIPEEARPAPVKISEKAKKTG